jgi:hypothetical protein
VIATGYNAEAAGNKFLEELLAELSLDSSYMDWIIGNGLWPKDS